MLSDGLIVSLFWSKAQSISSEDRVEMFPCILKSETSAVLCGSACPQIPPSPKMLIYIKKKEIPEAIDHTHFSPTFGTGAKEAYQQFSQYEPVSVCPLRFQMSHHVTVGSAVSYYRVSWVTQGN